MRERLTIQNRFNLKALPTSRSNDLFKDGVRIERGFLSSAIIETINRELDVLFEQPVMGTRYNGALKLDKHVKSISHPTNLSSINVLELAIDIFDLVVPLSKKDDYIVTNIEIFSEVGNKKRLFWHCDKRKIAYKALLYLKTSAASSGGLEYMWGTHTPEFAHTVERKLSSAEIDCLSRNIVDCSGVAGDLVMFDVFGFHCKKECVNERRALFFEFQTATSNRSKAYININNQQLTQKVLSKLKYFRMGDNSDLYGTHGLDGLNNAPRLYVSGLIEVILFLTSKFIQKIRNKTKALKTRLKI